MFRTTTPAQPNTGRHSWLSTLGLTAAAAAGGALAAHLLDPDRGRARRVRLRDQAAALSRRTARRTRRRLVAQRHYVGGRFERVRHELLDHPHVTRVDDVTLTQKIRSEILGRSTFHGYSISIDTCDGVVHLRGELPSIDVMTELEKAVERVPGVQRVENFLHLPGQPAPNKQDVRRTIR